MSIGDKYRPHYTYEDYLLWEGRWELIEGMPYAMSPAPAPNHQDINGNLFVVFKMALEKTCEKCKAYIPIDWKISENTVVQPDVLIVCKKIEKKYLDFTPALIVEILSPSTAYKDRHEKFELYEQEGVKYYLMVDPKFKKIEIYESVNGKYQLSATPSNQFDFNLESGCKFSINFDGIWP
jgi:Uma2 family endonuclease